MVAFFCFINTIGRNSILFYKRSRKVRVKKAFNAKCIPAVLTALSLVFAGCSKAPAAEAPAGNEDENNGVAQIDDDTVYPDVVEPEEENNGPIDFDQDGVFDWFPLENCIDNFTYMHSPLRDELSDYDVVANIIPDSIKYEGDGTVYFSSSTPDGGEMRFWGFDLEPSPEGIKFNTRGRLVSLDSIGRIYSLDPLVSENSDTNNWVSIFGVLENDLNMHPGSMENMVYHRGGDVDVNSYMEPYCSGDLLDLQPYFFGIGTANPNYEPDEYENPGYYVVSELNIVYRPETEMQPLRCVMLNPMNYGCYVEGDRYDYEKEGRFDWENQIYDFDLIGIPDIYEDFIEQPLDRFYIWDPVKYGYEFSYGEWSVGELRDSEGNVLDKMNTRVTSGMTLDVTIGDVKYDVPINVIDTVKDAQTQHDLQSNRYPIAVGDLNILCIPFSWSDERERATDAQLDEFRRELGRVSDMNGNVENYSDSANMKRFSLSDYMDIASYGKLNITTYMTDWYPCDMPFTDAMHQTGEYLYWEMKDWLTATYPDMDWDKFDLDGNHYFDSVIFLNAGDMSAEDGFDIISFGGAVCSSETYGANELYDPEFNNVPSFNTVVYCHKDLFGDSTLLHEFSHNLGPIDYYDVTYSGIDAIGSYDMQCGDDGDWNAFSKYSVGWIDPIRVSNLAPGESVEYEISPMSSSGDAIVIPAAGDDLDDPFGEYMLVDLFADVGTHIYDAPDFGLTNVVGVRIYHVDARMEHRDYLQDSFKKIVVPIGTVHYGNDYKPNGRFELELIQAGGTNTFTTLGGRAVINPSDFFMAGSSFTMEKYSQFFDGGVFDTGADFGYKIDIVSITGSGEDAKATVRVTRQ